MQILSWALVIPALAQNESAGLASLRVVEASAGGIVVEWTREAGPMQLLGWHVERQSADGGVVRVTEERVAAGLFDVPATIYRFHDAAADVRAGSSVAYRLVAVDPELNEWPTPFSSYVVESETAPPDPVQFKLPRTTPAPIRRAALPASIGARLRIAVTNDGLYRLTAGQIAAVLAGYDEAQVAQAIAQNGLALSCGGEAVAWRAEAGGAALLFFGQAYRDTYADANVYFLAPGPGLAMASAHRATAAVAADPWFWETVRAEQDLYFMSYVPGGVQDDYFVWAGQQLTAPAVSWQWTAPVALADLHPNMKQGQVTAHLVSAFNGAPALDNRTKLYAAGQLLDDRRWAGHLRLSQSGTATNLGGGSVSVTVELWREADVATTTVLMDALEVRYARRMRAKNDQLVFQPEAGTNTLTVRGFTTSAIQVFDITDPQRPVAVTTTVAQEGASDWRASWTADPLSARRYLAAAMALSPARIDGVSNEKWVGALAGAPHLVIAPQALTNAAAALVAHRKQRGLDSMLVPLEELYDAFAFGRRDPRAIPRFLANAKSRWTVPPAYVCLAGDGHLDYHDHFDQAQARPNHVPPVLDRIYQYSQSGGTQITLGLDNPLADTDGNGVPDLVIGRLPAQTPAALTGMIDRIVAHEASSAWKNKVLMTSDKDVNNVFKLANDRLAVRVPAGMSLQRLDHSASTPTATMRAQFIQGFNAGVALSVYVGHANNNGLSIPYFIEHNYIQSTMPALTNRARTPLMLAGACLMNNFAQPETDSRCLGKGFLDTAPGGAVAVWGSASETTLPMAENAIGAIMTALFARNDAYLGDLIRPALEFQAQSSMPWMIRSSVLMGDPGMRIQTSQAPASPPPTVEITHPSPLNYTPLALQVALPPTLPTYQVSTNRLDLAGIASSLNGVERVLIRNSQRAGEFPAAGTTNWSLNQLALGEGTNLISAIAYDWAGHSSTAALKVVCTLALGPEIKVNCGSGVESGDWLADRGATAAAGIGTASTTAAILNAGDVPQSVYQTRRHGKLLTYNLAIPDGTYMVRLHFAESYWTRAGRRRFNVSIEGQPALANFDIWAAAGGKNRAVTKTFEFVEVRGGLQIQAAATADSAQINGIEVWLAPPRVIVNPSAVMVPEGGRTQFGVKLSDAPTGTVTVNVVRDSGDEDLAVASGSALVFDADNFGIAQPVILAAREDADSANGAAEFRCSAEGYVAGRLLASERDSDSAPVIRKINAGGRASSGGWAGDAGGTVTGGGASSTRSAIENTGDVPPAVYQTRRYGRTVTYNLKIPDGKYTVRLHFAELVATNAGQHQFNVWIEGQPVLADFDICAETGGKNRALVRTFADVEVRGGLQIQGVGTVGLAQFNGIEVSEPRVLVNPAAVSVPEGCGRAVFGVKLSDAPAGAVTVAVARASGDADISVAFGSALVFTAGNYATEQMVTLAAQVDDDAANGLAVIRCRATGYMSGHVAATEQDREAAPVIRKINAGGRASSGGWVRDAGGTVTGGGASSTRAIIENAGDVPQAVYQTRRYGRTATYNLKIPDGKYTVRLHFAELVATNAGQHQFNVSIEGQPVLADFDIFAEAGGKNRALVRTFTDVEVRGGLQIQGVGTVGLAQFNGIEVESPRVIVNPSAVSVSEGGSVMFGVKLSDAPASAVTVLVARASGDADISVASGNALVFTADNYATEQMVTLAAQADDDALNGTAVIRCRAAGYMSGHVVATEQDSRKKINCGGGAAADGWAADAGWTAMSGVGSGKSQVSIANPGDVPASVYQSRRWGKTLNYNLSVPDGTYTVRLHFAELSATRAGQRRFNVSIEGRPALTDFDIFDLAGGKNRTLIYVFENVEVRGGLQIQGVGTVGVAQFNGIEVNPAPAQKMPRSLAAKSGVAPTSQGLDPAMAPSVAVAAASEPWPLAVARSGDAEWLDAACLVDGDTNTLWTGEAGASAWTVALDFEESLSLDSLDIVYEGQPWPEVNVVGTDNLLDWYDLDQITDRPVACRAVYLIFRGDGSGPAPAIREIQWGGELPF